MPPTAQALSATSSNIANVNTVGYKDATANFSTFLNAAGPGGNSSAGVAAVIGQDVTTQGLPTTTSSPTDLSISGNGFFVVATNTTATAHQEYTRAGSFTPGRRRQSGQRRGPLSAGLQAGFRRQCAHQHQRAEPDQRLQPVGQGRRPPPSWRMQANLQSSATVDADLYRRRHERRAR